MSKSKYSARPFDLSCVRTYPLGSRPGKVDARAFARPHRPGGSLADFLDGLPRLLAAESLQDLARAVVRAREAGKPVLWGLGAHVIKTGLSPVIIDLMDRGLVSGIALNGAGAIHDFEIALTGSTSEDVESQLHEGALRHGRGDGVRHQQCGRGRHGGRPRDRRVAIGRHLGQSRPLSAIAACCCRPISGASP